MPQSQVLIFRETDGSVALVDWLSELERREPKSFARCLERMLQLEAHGYELKRPVSAPLRDGIHELRFRVGKVHYRVLYFFSGANVVCVSHGLTKEDKVPSKEIDLAVYRASLVKRNPMKHTAEWEI